MRRTLVPGLITAAALSLFALLAPTAEAQTMIPGGTVFGTWTAAGSPYIVQGDVTVPGTTTLTIQAGVQVLFESGDMQASGRDTSRTEITVNGTLNVQGTAASPVIFRARSGTSAGSWYGIIISSTAMGADIDHAELRHARRALESATPGTLTQVDDVLIDSCSDIGLYIDGGSASYDRVSVSDCVNYGVYVADGTPTLDALVADNTRFGVYVANQAGATIQNAIVRDQGSYGVYASMSSSSDGDVNVFGSTVYNSRYGVYLSASSGTTRSLVVRNSNLTDSTSYGAFRSGSYGRLEVTYTNSWGNGNNLSGTTGSVGNLSANPLYVSASNLRLTSNSPSRFAGNAGQDLGPLPYVADATVGLIGYLWSNLTLTAAGSPYVIRGDLTVPAGSTLTIEAGAQLHFETGDLMGSNRDTSRSEITVDGTLNMQGTAASPVVLRARSGISAGTWYGVVISPVAGSADIDHAEIRHARRALESGTPGSVTQVDDVLIDSCSDIGLYIDGGSASYDRVRISDCVNYGVYVADGTPTLDGLYADNTRFGVYVANQAGATIQNAIVRDQGSYGVYASMSSSSDGDVTLLSSTVYNSRYGVYLSASSGTTRSLVVRNSILTDNTSYGAFRSGSYGRLEVTYTDSWGNGSNLSGTTGSAGNISANPQYVNASGGNLRVMSTSVTIDAGTASGAPPYDVDGVARPLDGNGFGGAQYDMGAYEYVLMAMCGNGLIEAPEVCDDGGLNGSYGACASDCSGSGPRCGDGVRNGPEACDDGNAIETDACLSDCSAASCGDGFVQTGVEDCDDGNMIDTDACVMCSAAICGDGAVRSGVEDCDD
ncbi:MAG TPA: hypothetical protein DEF51_45955, partial [Myxococcales bacterium]|nr:hypothetical protein [Myxococcales bacterium]